MHAPQVPEPSRIRFRCKARTRWSDEDNQNVLNNAVYMTLLEEGRHAYFERLGLLELNHFPFVLASCNIRFVSPGRGGADVELEVVTTRLGTSSFEQAYRVRETPGLKKKPSTSELLDWLKLLLAEDIPPEALRTGEGKSALPPLYGALLKNEQDVHLFERLVFLDRAARR